jgi:hypothetical protein
MQSLFENWNECHLAQQEKSGRDKECVQVDAVPDGVFVSLIATSDEEASDEDFFAAAIVSEATALIFLPKGKLLHII